MDWQPSVHIEIKRGEDEALAPEPGPRSFQGPDLTRTPDLEPIGFCAWPACRRLSPGDWAPIALPLRSRASESALFPRRRAC